MPLKTISKKEELNENIHSENTISVNSSTGLGNSDIEETDSDSPQPFEEHTKKNDCEWKLIKETEEKNSYNFYCFGFSYWKYDYIRKYLYSPDGSVEFFKSKSKLKKCKIKDNAVFIVWGYNDPVWLKEFLTTDIPLYRMEDGFLRSIGLGSDINAPASLVIDTKGIYYNPNEPSDLEHILEHEIFTEDTIKRADKLRTLIIETKISKYNVDGGERIDVSKAGDKKIILVPGQVEDDASIQLGTVDIKTNLQLLEAARENRPDAYVIFKPHPDVVSGNRKGNIPAEKSKVLADLVLEDSSLAHCLDVADEVHTMTSLVGFEALLRGLEVSVYGRPFYGGWGLTNDRQTFERRSKKLSLSELIAGALIKYPRYVDPDTFTFTTPENIVLKLKTALEKAGQIKTKTWKPLRQLKRLFKLIKASI